MAFLLLSAKIVCSSWSTGGAFPQRALWITAETGFKPRSLGLSSHTHCFCDHNLVKDESSQLLSNSELAKICSEKKDIEYISLVGQDTHTRARNK